MRVIVTRPEHDASDWVQGLESAGLDVAQLPLIAIRPMTDGAPLRSAWQNLHRYAAVMFVSGNAVNQFFLSKPNDAQVSNSPIAVKTRVWATGPGTTRALLEAGVAASSLDTPPRDAGQFDSEALWAVVSGSVRRDDKILIVRGSDSVVPHSQAGVDAPSAFSGTGRDWLAARLTEAGAQVDFVVAYERYAPLLSNANRQLARQAAVDGSVWLLSSSEAVANLCALIPDQSWARARAVATHSRIAGRARQLGFGVVCESRPVLSSVVASIESMR